MKANLILIASIIATSQIHAFPPAPHHEVYGTVRDEQGNPVTGNGTVTFSGTEGTILTGLIDLSIEPGVNYSMKVPMDAGTLGQLYQSSALLPTAPFSATVTINGVNHVPIEVQGGTLAIGESGKKTRLDLTLGVDSDGDGLPDSWEQRIIASMDGIDSLDQVTRDGDLDGDGVSNYTEYLVGTYAFDKSVNFNLEIIEVTEGLAQFRFLAVKGRTYQLHTSTNGKDFTPLEFALTKTAEAEGNHPAQNTRYQNIFIPAELVGSRLFRLHVR